MIFDLRYEIDLDNSEGDNIRALPNNSIFSDLMTKTIRRLMIFSNSRKIKSSPSGATFPRVPINTLSGDKLRIRDNDYELTPKIYKASSYTGCSGGTMKNEEDISMMHIIKNDLGYTGVGDRPSNRKTFLTTKPPKLVDEIQNRTFDELDLEGPGIHKIIISSNVINIYTR